MRGSLQPNRRLIPGPAVLGLVTVFGAALGTAWDLLHVRTDTTAYALGDGRLPLWVPLEFALVYAAGVLGIALLGAPVPDRRSPARLAFETCWVSAVYATTAVAHRSEWVVVAVAALGLLARRRTLAATVRANPLPAAALVVLGPAVEAAVVAAGVFSYERASLGGIPVWLPLLYANAVPFSVRLAETALRPLRAPAAA